MVLPPKMIVGNWKMNGLTVEAGQKAQDLVLRLQSFNESAGEVVICPPFTSLQQVRGSLEGSPVKLGAQDCHDKEFGAYTGDISAAMLKDVGCSFVIVGHSERRVQHHEVSLQIAAKAKAAHDVGLVAIVCVGESLEQRDAGFAQKIVGDQIKESLPPSATNLNTVIAYEPVWAIGSGKSASFDDIADMHAFIRSFAPDKRILYGGSVNETNAADIFKIQNVDGVLVGGASLKMDSFQQIIAAAVPDA